MAALAALHLADPPDLWGALGFVVEDESVKVSGVRLMLGAEGKGIRSWSLRGLAPEVDGLDGAAFGLPAFPARATPAHPNGVIALDHLVVTSPDILRTIASVEAAGIECRRIRDIGTDAAPMQQAFFRLGQSPWRPEDTVILEAVGPTTPTGEGPMRLYGLAWTVRDLDATAGFLGDRLRASKDAVQPGRRIATLDRSAGSTVAQAFMSRKPSDIRDEENDDDDAGLGGS